MPESLLYIKNSRKFEQSNYRSVSVLSLFSKILESSVFRFLNMLISFIFCVTFSLVLDNLTQLRHA